MNSSTYQPPTLLQQRVPHRTIALQALHIPFAAPVAAFSVATATCSFAFEAEASFSQFRIVIFKGLHQYNYCVNPESLFENCGQIGYAHSSYIVVKVYAGFFSCLA